jgi:superfamily II RNA helicase
MDFAKQENDNSTLDEIYNRWGFALSPFQKKAISAIYNNKSAIITAHTGCGKTLPAEYAITHYANLSKKVIYTCPIKALSNEKFEDFQKKYPHISFGLITGDNIINPDAQCLLMTTEILRNTLFKMKMIQEGTIENDNTLHFEMDIQRELGSVVFDEIHYINDHDRGTVWEESIMMLPNHIPILGLSATLEKPEKFIKWLGKKNLEVVLCGTDKRIVPLSHKGFITFPPSCTKKMSPQERNILDNYYNTPIIIKNSNGTFNEVPYIKMCKVFKILDRYKIRVDKYYAVNKLLRHLKDDGRLPAICFIFSKKQTWEFAQHVNFSLFDDDSKVPSIIEQECKAMLIKKLNNWKEYVELPEFKQLVKCLEKGIGIHHAGIIGVFREMVEKLFHKGYIKVMFATETLGIGINMPTKSVIYTSMMKFSGKGFRWLYPHEISQTSGRAGRRGIDDKGEAYHLLNLYNAKDKLPDTIEFRHMLTGNAQAIETKFKIHFNLILRLIAVKNYNFSDFVNDSMLNESINRDKIGIKKQLDAAKINLTKAENNIQFITGDKELLQEYIDIKSQIRFVKPKKRKALDRKMKELSDYKGFVSDLSKWEAINTNKKNVMKYEKQFESVSQYVDIEISRRLIILERLGFIETCNDPEIPYILTEKGEIATNLQEIHCLAMADIIHNKDFNKLGTEEIVGVLSCFTHVRLSDENKIWEISKITNCTENMKKVIGKVKKKYDEYYDMETKEETNFIYNYAIQYDVCELAYRWCFATNEVECKKIYEESKYYGIFVGEWIKVILKINNIVKELEKVCSITNNLELLEKLKKISDVTLKSVATNQSLYL